MAMKLNKSQLVKASNQLDRALEALDLLVQYQEGAKLMDESKIDFSAIVRLKNSVDELSEKKSRKKRSKKESALRNYAIKRIGKKPLLFLLKQVLQGHILKLKEVIKFQAMPNTLMAT